MEQALDAARSAVTDSTASGAKKAGLNWSWADGAAVSPQEIKSSELPKSDYVTKVDHKQGVASYLEGVTQDGLGFGRANSIDVGEWSQYTTAGPKKLAKGLPRDGQAMRDGNTIYFVAESGQVFRINEPGKNKKATKLVKLPNGAGDLNKAVIGGGRVYWEQEVSVGKGLTSLEVRSAPLKGGASRLEARNAAGVQLTDQGVLAASVAPSKEHDSGARYTGIVKLSGGKAEPFLNLPETAAKKGFTFDTLKPFTASGHSLALPQDGGKNTMVVNLRTRQAWEVKNPKGMNVRTASASEGRVAWTAGGDVPPEGTVSSRRVFIADLDQGVVRTVTAPKGAGGVAVNGQHVAWFYGDGGPASAESMQSIELNR
ncbi:hypothetical protein DWQ67_10795 [Galactobacter caseinivorans]|uniref:Uncharacterized protein n=2 Tax=Galactobacter caseinivorans TaxID=2676123 RepID=A0A496PHI0_9MICC|nr:hypothetical protein DWQ67_10795 [Galactobacter caseinivorans]